MASTTGDVPEIDFSTNRMTQVALMATAVSSSPFVIYGIWCTLGLFFRHSTYYGWAWLLCFLVAFFFSDILETGSMALKDLARRYLPLDSICQALPQFQQPPPSIIAAATVAYPFQPATSYRPAPPIETQKPDGPAPAEAEEQPYSELL